MKNLLKLLCSASSSVFGAKYENKRALLPIFATSFWAY
jgi:hypothetical protein